MRLRHPCPLPLSAWQSEIAIGNRDGIRPNRLNLIVLPWQSRWNRRFDRIIGNTVNITQTGAVNVQFGIGSTASIRSVTVKTLIGLVNFYVVKVDTPFLLYLIDINRL